MSEQIGFDWNQQVEAFDATQEQIYEIDAELAEEPGEPAEEIAEPPVEEPTHVELEKNGQIPLINIGEWWEEHWKQMPEFVQKDISPFKTIYIHFETRADMESFIELVGQRITLDTKSIWYPEAETNDFSKKRYADAYQPGKEDESELSDFHN